MFLIKDIHITNQINNPKFKILTADNKSRYEIIKEFYKIFSLDLRNIFEENEVLDEHKLYIETKIKDPAMSIEILIKIKNLGALHEEKAVWSGKKLNREQIKEH